MPSCSAASSSDCSAASAGPRPALERRSQLSCSSGDFAALPGAFAQLHGGLEKRELVDPGREAAGPAEVVQPGKHAHQRVVRRLERDLAELIATQMWQSGPAPGNLEACSPKKQRVQALHGCFAHWPLRTQVLQPDAGLLVEEARGNGI
jgi:hypothetical protein